MTLDQLINTATCPKEKALLVNLEKTTRETRLRMKQLADGRWIRVKSF